MHEETILISIHPRHVQNIVERKKDHEFRNYQLPTTELWIYTTKPEARIQYKIVTTPPKKQPEQIPPSGVGNQAFNQQKSTQYAHPIQEVYELHKPIPLDELREEHHVTPPQKYTYIRTHLSLQQTLQHKELRRIS